MSRGSLRARPAGESDAQIAPSTYNAAPLKKCRDSSLRGVCTGRARASTNSPSSCKYGSANRRNLQILVGILTDRVGLGSALVARLTPVAKANGIQALVADTMSSNFRMLAVFRNSGLLSSSVSAGITEVRLELQPPLEPASERRLLGAKATRSSNPLRTRRRLARGSRRTSWSRPRVSDCGSRPALGARLRRRPCRATARRRLKP